LPVDKSALTRRLVPYLQTIKRDWSPSITRERIRGEARMKPILIVEDEAIIRESLRDWLPEQDLNL